MSAAGGGNKRLSLSEQVRNLGWGPTGARFILTVGPVVVPLVNLLRQLSNAGPGLVTALSAELTGFPHVEIPDLRTLLPVPSGVPSSDPGRASPALTLVNGPLSLDLTGALGHVALLDRHLRVTLTVNGRSERAGLNRDLAFRMGTLAQACPAAHALPPRPPPPSAPPLPLPPPSTTTGPRLVRYLRVTLLNDADVAPLNLLALMLFNGPQTMQRTDVGTSSPPLTERYQWFYARDGSQGSFFHSQNEPPIFLELDFGAAGVPGTEVRVKNRTDCCQDRLAKYKVIARGPDGSVLLERALGSNLEYRFPL